MEKKFALLFAFLITFVFIFNSFAFQQNSYLREIKISRVIDGDTFVSTAGETFRLVNVNTPEKNEVGYSEAKEFLLKYENLSVKVDSLGQDKYQRTLARVYAGDYVNLKLVEKGLAKKFLVQENELTEFNNAEDSAVSSEIGIWKKSKYSKCISISLSEIEETVTIKNSCEKLNLSGWIVTDESRKRYKFPNIEIGEVTLHTNEGKNNQTDIFWNSAQNVWNNDRDTLYFFDSENNLVFHYSYGY